MSGFDPMANNRIPKIKAALDCRAIFREHWPDHFRERGNSLCPWHSDSNPSLQVTRELAYCHACQKKADAIDLTAEAFGVSTAEAIRRLSDELGLGNGQAARSTGGGGEPSKRIVARYPYVDRNGSLLFEVVRLEPKSFRQRRPDGNGGWVWNLNGVERVLYRLPEVLKAGQVFIVEGEKDADRLAELGLTATTCPGGAGKWRSEYCSAFSGVEEVTIIPDNDEPGRKHAVDVLEKLHRANVIVGQNLKMLDLPDLPAKGDVSDWFGMDHGKEDLLRLVNAVPRWKQDAPSDSDGDDAVCFGDAILDADAFVSLQIPGKKAFLHPWLSEQSIIFITGWRGIGKTGFAMGVVDAVTKSQPFGPWTPGEPVNCLYLDGEMAAQDVQKRLQDLGTANRKSKLFVYSDAYAHSLGLPKANLLNEEWRAGFQKTLLDLGVKVWVCDNLAALSGGIDENSKEEWDPIGAWLLQLRFAGITTILIHHEGKTGQQRGTSAREDHADISISLKKPHDYTAEQGARFIVNFTKSRIETEHLPMIVDTDFQLVNTLGDTREWTWRSAQQATRTQILKYLDEGMNQTDVADLLKVSKGYVSKVRTAAINAHWLTEKNKLTQLGFSALEG